MHKHLVFTGVSYQAPKDPEYIKRVLLDLVEVAKMEVFMPPQAKYCEDPTNAGVTGTVVITTSHASIHIWDNGLVQADLYSCKDFNTDEVAAFLAEVTYCEQYDTLVIDRALSPRLQREFNAIQLELA